MIVGVVGYMNVALEQTEEIVDGSLKQKYGDTFIRGNNILYISTQKRKAKTGGGGLGDALKRAAAAESGAMNTDEVSLLPPFSFPSRLIYCFLCFVQRRVAWRVQD